MDNYGTELLTSCCINIYEHSLNQLFVNRTGWPIRLTMLCLPSSCFTDHSRTIFVVFYCPFFCVVVFMTIRHAFWRSWFLSQISLLSLNNVNTKGAFGLVLAYLLLLCFLRGISSPWSFPWSLYIKCLFFSLFHSTPWRDPRHRLEGNLGDIMILLGEAALPRVGVDS